MAGLFDEQNGGLVTYWKSVAAITALVGSTTNARIYPDQAKQGAALPHLVYTRASGGNVFRHLAGMSGVRTSVLHVYAYDSSRSGADALAEAVKQSMHSGFARASRSGVWVNACFVDDATDDGVDDVAPGTDVKKYWSRLVLRIVHAET